MEWNKEIILYTLVHRFNNRWRWCRFAPSIFKTMGDDMHKLKFKQNSIVLLDAKYYSLYFGSLFFNIYNNLIMLLIQWVNCVVKQNI